MSDTNKNPLRYREHYRRCLPHWQPSGKTFFVTFRLADTLPKPMMERYRLEVLQSERGKTGKMGKMGKALEALSARNRRKWFARLEATLDGGSLGPNWLRRSNVARMVGKAIEARNAEVYDLACYCMMPNHDHIVFTPLPAQSDGEPAALAGILHSLKRYTASEANRMLGRPGAFWAGENFDHWIRDKASYERIVRYVLENPVKAGIVKDWREWPGTYLKAESALGS
ncbi:MAG: hypothetical protein L6R28_11430 [Planctomycetes bacterium]|nr:hypothetical protein [Planctomycetota bacterium]